ncbi:hypothetical protein J7F01_32980 [Streptomyces sp. ISL-22]|uniref:hypothetical protein n=1 Tax=unclassified Streptomyces TaxID=2593676 RepID=UPI001BE8FEB1|nr:MULTISPECIES: hypothetical protein [unclassified Streptomyces]MBT2419390.1 hypothetical protein [Streptomyces sp. ISL-24]MBT2436886.1 hypothetical protein [Streptomyces sp. ISL-22]
MQHSYALYGAAPFVLLCCDNPKLANRPLLLGLLLGRFCNRQQPLAVCSAAPEQAGLHGATGRARKRRCLLGGVQRRCVGGPAEPGQDTAFIDGLITGLYAVRNPEKLSGMRRETALHR